MSPTPVTFYVNISSPLPWTVQLTNPLDRADLQPSQCRWEVVPDTADKRRVLGGTKAGNGAWAVAWVDTVMEVPPPMEEPSPPPLPDGVDMGSLHPTLLDT